MANPVVVVGMHRSGTSLVSRILDDCGVMMGKDLQEDHESIFFISLNEWIYGNAGASWERPGALLIGNLVVEFEGLKAKTEGE